MDFLFVLGLAVHLMRTPTASKQSLTRVALVRPSLWWNFTLAAAVA